MHSFKRSAALALAAVVSIAGCKGSKGDTGPAGATGPTGPQGPITTTNESCMICHASTRLVPTAANHATAFAGGYQDTLAITNVAVTNVGGQMQIAFHVGNSAGGQTVANADVRVMIAGLVPKAATPASSTEAASYFQLWRTERTSAGYDPFGTLTAGATTGDYTYLTSANISAAPAASTIQRIFLRVAKTGNFTANATYDFDKADATMASVANPRDIVPSASCNKCHFERIADHGHGGGYNQSNACIVCHSPRYPTTSVDMLADGFDFVTMVHQIHAAYDHTKGGTAAGMDWSAVTYPSQLNDCAVCHTGGTASANYKDNPNAIACTSCHTFVQFTDSPGYSASTVACGDPAWVYPNPCNHSPARATTANCSGCHTDSGDAADVTIAHDPTYNRVHGAQQNNVPEYNVNLAIAAPTAGTFYVPGTDTLNITITLTNKSDNSAVPSSFYTSAKHATGTTSATALSNARLYIYGPRTAPKPVLTAGAAVTPTPTQSTQLFATPTPTDTNVKTDATGFKYQVAIPAGFPAGTYFVRFYATNYGYVSDTNYVTDSNAFAVIQIGTATAQAKVAGDACVNCHGTHLAPFHDARHGVKFDTDECISCHDLSGNHAAPLANRIHAVHASSVSGDIFSLAVTGDPAEALSWAEVEYPVSYRSGSGINNAVPPGATMRCAVCHTTANTQFQTNVGELTCMGCHADAPGALDHFRQNGGQY